MQPAATPADLHAAGEIFAERAKNHHWCNDAMCGGFYIYFLLNGQPIVAATELHH